MLDIAYLANEIARVLGVTPATAALYIFLISTFARAISRRIPDDATGALAVLRVICKVLGVEVESRLTSDVTVKDVAKAAAETPPIEQKVKTAEPPEA